MNKLLSIAIFASLLLTACGPAEPEGKLDSDKAPEVGQESTSTAPTSAGDPGIQVHGAGAGGIAPVTGTESLQGSGGGGGGVQQAAKSKALDAAASAGGGSLDQMDDSGE